MSLTFASCKKSFLEIPPSTSISTVTFYKTQSDFQQAVVGAYAPLSALYGNSVSLPGQPDPGDWGMDEMRSDNTGFIFSVANRGFVGHEQLDQFIDDGNNASTINKYSSDYTIIGRANQILATIDAASFDATHKNTYKGEALFLRAFAYFDLVQYYGDVPLSLIPVTNIAQTQIPRAPIAQVYTQIISDAKLAVTLLPTKTNAAVGHVTANTANMLLGNVYMVQKQWVSAETVLQTIVTSGEYSLLANYASIFSNSNKNNPESLFEIQYVADPSQAGLQNGFGYEFIPALANPNVLPGYPSSSTNLFGNWNLPTPDLINAYEAGDQRLAANIAYITVTGVTYPYLKKYVQGATLYPYTDDDWQVYRYAEVLLFLAEAYNEDGKFAQGIPLINQVRARAGLAGVTATDQASLRIAIAHERQVEFAGESKRWKDLLRTGTALTVMNAQAAAIRANPTAYYYPVGVPPVPAAFNVTQNRLLFPIPNNEIQLNPLLKQNPGY